MKVASMGVAELDAWMYKHACVQTGRSVDARSFEEGYAKGQFHFSEDAALLAELVSAHAISVHKMSDEWLAFADSVRHFADTPLLAAIRVIIEQQFGGDLEVSPF